MRSTLKSVSFLFLVLTLLLGAELVAPSFASAQLSEREIREQEEKLQEEYDVLQQDIVKWEGILNETRAKANTIQGDISHLNAKIKEAELTIRAKNIAITQIGKDIGDKTQKIAELEGQIERGKESLAQLLRKTNEIDSYTLVEVMFANEDLSDFFQDLDTFTSIKRSMQGKFSEIRDTKALTEVEREQLDQKRNAENDAKYVVEGKKKTIVQSETEKKQLLAVTKQEEKAYADVLAERQARAAQIRAALFRLRDTEGINFGQALQYANVASQSTGIRPALILAILTQESDLGKNQGSCLVTDITTGNGVGKNTGTPFDQVMKAPRDTAPFESITKRLGRDYKMTPVSCPPAYTYTPGRGFGGGMGPSQFIPSTWELFKGRIGSSLGISADEADPWNPEHAFTATAIYMSDLGAVASSFTAERNAACRYYSGAACTPGRVPANTFYGDQVMQKAEAIQANIDFLKDA
jgi:peptidoglycan hydrolase CwlO-like protein